MTRGDNRNAEGIRICRWCKQPVPPPKLTFCSQPCVHEWKLRTQPSYRKLHVDIRDNGICAICGTDTYAQQAHYRGLMDQVGFRTGWHQKSRSWPASMAVVVREAMMDGMSVAQLFRLVTRATPYDIDHTVPLIEGGGHGLDNVRTLCIGCHHTVTQQLRHRLKSSK